MEDALCSKIGKQTTEDRQEKGWEPQVFHPDARKAAMPPHPPSMPLYRSTILKPTVNFLKFTYYSLYSLWNQELSVAFKVEKDFLPQPHAVGAAS